MTEPFLFADKLRFYVDRSAYTPGQLAGLTDLPRTTIVNWLNGRVQRPRDWQPIVKLLAVLHLDESEADEVLQAASQPTIAGLRLIVKKGQDRELLAAWERPTPKPIVTYRPPFQTIADTPFFVGRQTVLEQLESHLLSQSGSAICVLQGMAGSGKTATAARIAYRLRSRFPDGVLWARLDVSDTMMILHTFAQAYGADVGQFDDVASRSRVVRDLLADKRALIVLDNAWDSAGVEPLLPPTGHCAVLITSRRHDLRVAQGANRMTLQPFRAESEAGKQLFAHFLGQERVNGEAELLAEIIASVGRLPLALAIVAGRLAYEPGWSTADFLARLRQSSRRLKELQSEDQSIRLSFNASYELLPNEVKPFFAALSRFGGEDFSPAAAAAAANVSLEDGQDYLRMLYRLSLVQAGRTGRYQLHLLLRDYARENLPETAVWTPLANYFRIFLDEHPLGDPVLVVERENISAVIAGAMENGETAAAIELLIAFVPFLKQQGLYTTAQDQLQTALPVASNEQRLHILLYLSQITRYYRLFDEADGYLERAVRLAQERRNGHILGAVKLEAGIIAGCRGDYEGARDQFQAGLALARQANDPVLLVPLLKELGAIEVVRGDYRTAETNYQAALKQARESSSAYMPMLLRCLGGIAIIRDGDFRRAGQLYAEGLSKAREMNSQEDIIFMLNNLAAVALQQGRPDEAEAYLTEGLALSKISLHQVGTAMIVGNLGRLAAHQQRWMVAEQYLQEGLEVATAANHQQMINTFRNSLASLADWGEKFKGDDQLVQDDSAVFERLKIFYD